LIEADCIKKVETINQRRKHDYAVNRSCAAGFLKTKIYELFLGKHPKKVYQELIDLFSSHLEAVRPNRNVPRAKKRKEKGGKYRPMHNYKRAI